MGYQGRGGWGGGGGSTNLAPSDRNVITEKFLNNLLPSYVLSFPNSGMRGKTNSKITLHKLLRRRHGFNSLYVVREDMMDEVGS